MTLKNKLLSLRDLAFRNTQLWYSLSKINRILELNRDGVKQDYDGGKTEGDIVSWYLKKSMATAPEITCPQIKDKITENKLVAIFFGD